MIKGRKSIYKLPNLALFLHDKKNTISIHKIGKWCANEINTVLSAMQEEAENINFILRDKPDSYILRMTDGQFREIELV